MLLSTRMTFASYGIGKKRCPRLDATCSQLEDVTHDKGVVQFSSGEVAVSSPRPAGAGGGGTWVFFGWVCAARDQEPMGSCRDSKLVLRSKKSFP